MYTPLGEGSGGAGGGMGDRRRARGYIFIHRGYERQEEARCSASGSSIASPHQGAASTNLLERGTRSDECVECGHCGVVESGGVRSDQTE